MQDTPLDGFNGRITINPAKMGGKPCIRGMRITAATVVNCIADGMSNAEVLEAYPYLEQPDLDAALKLASAMMDDRFLPVPSLKGA